MHLSSLQNKREYCQPRFHGKWAICPQFRVKILVKQLWESICSCKGTWECQQHTNLLQLKFFKVNKSVRHPHYLLLEVELQRVSLNTEQEYEEVWSNATYSLRNSASTILDMKACASARSNIGTVRVGTIFSEVILQGNDVGGNNFFP